MSLYCDKSVEIEVIDNGWILTWEDKTKDRDEDKFTQYGIPRIKHKERGREIFTDEKKLLKRVKELIW